MTLPMRSFLRLLVPALFLLFLLPATGSAETVRFLSLIDGDSLRVLYKGRALEVRLIGIDAPESKQEYGPQAKSHALKSSYGKEMRLEFDQERHDRYGRTLAYVYCGDVMLNEEMVRAGYALAIKVKPNTKYYERFKRAEADARTQRRGFWLRGGLKETPAQWRKRNRR